MPTRRMRFPAPAKRRLNHCVSALPGCRRNQPQASSTSRPRTRRLPALLMPCSISLSPLAYGVGTRPRLPASSRRLAKCRQPNTSFTSTQAPLAPIARSRSELRDQRLLALGQLFARAASIALTCSLTSFSRAALSLDLRAQLGGTCSRCSFHHAGQSRPPMTIRGPQVVQHQQRADPVRVRDALVRQPLQLSVHSARVLVARGSVRAAPTRRAHRRGGERASPAACRHRADRSWLGARVG